MATHSSILAWSIPCMDRGAWWATVHGVTKSRTRLSDFTFTFTILCTNMQFTSFRKMIKQFWITNQKLLKWQRWPFIPSKKAGGLSLREGVMLKDGVWVTQLVTWKEYSLVVQWLRIRLAMQGTPVRSLVWEDPTCHRATKPMCQKYWSLHGLEPARHIYWTSVLQLLKPMHLEPVLCNKRSHHKKPVHWTQLEGRASLLQPCTVMKTQFSQNF